MAEISSKQVRYIHGMVGQLIDSNKFQDRHSLWEQLELLPETTIKELDTKQGSKVIKALKQLTEN